MKLEPVDIQIDDIKLFTDVCLIFDQDEFLEKLIEIRKKLGIEILISDSQWQEYKHSQHFNLKAKEKYNQAIFDIRDKFLLPRTYLSAIDKALLMHKVENGDYAPQIMTIEHDGLQQGWQSIPIAVITLAPGFNNDAVKEMLKEYRRVVEGNKQEGYGYNPPSSRLGLEAKPEIKKHRHWYLLNHFEGKEPADITDLEDYPEYAEHDLKTIQDGIENYKNRLGGN